jgi:hypothetical protein
VNTSSGFQPRQSTSSGSDSRNQHSSFAKGHDKWIPFGVQHNHSVDKKE